MPFLAPQRFSSSQFSHLSPPGNGKVWSYPRGRSGDPPHQHIGFLEDVRLARILLAVYPGEDPVPESCVVSWPNQQSYFDFETSQVRF